MRKWTVLAAGLIAVFVSACASPPQMSRDEWLASTTRIYPDKTPDDVFRAAERLFRLADGDDFQISYTRDAMHAFRPWSVYVVLAAVTGTDIWTVSTETGADSVRVFVELRTTTTPIGAVPTGNGGAAPLTGPATGGGMVQGTAIYDLFWTRMDYLLGHSDHWETCPEADAKVTAKAVWGSNEALCNSFNVKDAAP